VVEVNVRVADGVDEVARFQAAALGHQPSQKRIPDKTKASKKSAAVQRRQEL
jgi:hypothetical protein